MSFTIGSLFDGSGGFPLAAFLCGGTPLWASEVEPYPIAVTKTRFPHMKHLGSVTEVKGNEVEPVDVITFGSPCQDLSIAGKRAGLKHEGNGDEETTRSGLFMEAVRIIKEMREATNGVYPRFALWENVPGAFSSNKGEDFRIVLEELIKIVEAEAEMPPVPEGGWPYADCYLGDGWRLAYRVFDAQYWGVPQRRRRIFLVLDLGGQCAGEVSFEREGLRGYFAEGRTPWESLAGDAERSSGAADCETECVTYCGSFLPQKKAEGMAGSTEDVSGTLHNGACPGYQNGIVLADVPYLLKIRSGCEGGGKGALIQTDMSATLSTLNDQYLFQPILDDQGGSQISVRYDGKCPTLRAEAHGNVPCVMESAGFKEHNSANAYSNGYEEEIAPCLSANKHDASVCIKGQYLFENHSQDARYKGPLDVCPMLPAQLGTGGNNTPLVVACIDGDKIGKADRAGGSGLGIRDGDKMYTLTAKDAGTHAVCIPINDKATRYKGGGPAPTLRTTGSPPGGAVRYIVRRLTPTECARLQGFADSWAHPDTKTEFTDEEYEFWLNVRNTHAEINGKAVKPYTKDQMLKWYNKLHTDSSEYKLWGNGIALPCALYVMQGIGDVLG